MLGELENIWRKGCREKGDLDVSGQVLEDVLDLGLEATGEHLISLIKGENFQVVCLEEATLHHVKNATGCADNDVNTALKNSDILTDNGTTDAGMYFDVGKLADRMNDVGNLHGELTSGSNDQSLDVV